MEAQPQAVPSSEAYSAEAKALSLEQGLAQEEVPSPTRSAPTKASRLAKKDIPTNCDLGQWLERAAPAKPISSPIFGLAFLPLIFLLSNSKGRPLLGPMYSFSPDLERNERAD